MKKNYTVDSLYRNNRKIKPWLIIVLLLLISLILAILFSFVKVYRMANVLANRKPEPFADVAENAMPAHTSTSFLSQDKSLQLEAWFFKRTTNEFRGNIIFVHNNRDNRVQFNLETADLFSNFMDNGFNLLAFDLRNCGRSDGDLASYGYAEHQDVISAMQQMYHFTGQKNFILFGVGSGCAASLLAWNELSPTETDTKQGENAESAIYKEDITGLILDTPAASPDDYIRADLPNASLFDRLIISKFVPTAIKTIAGYTDEGNLTTMITQFTQPVLITRNLPNTKIEKHAIDTIIDERLRLHPDTTTVFETAEAGHLNGYNLNKENYLEQINRFLDIWYPDLTDLLG